MNLTAHLYRAAHNFPPGMGTLASALGIAESSLQNKVSITNPGAHCSPEEMARILELTGDHGALHALNARLGYVAMPAPQLADHADASVVERATTAFKKFSDLMSEVSADVADGCITDNEQVRIDGCLSEAISALQQLTIYTAQINKRGKQVAATERSGLKAA